VELWVTPDGDACGFRSFDDEDVRAEAPAFERGGVSYRLTAGAQLNVGGGEGVEMTRDGVTKHVAANAFNMVTTEFGWPRLANGVLYTGPSGLDLSRDRWVEPVPGPEPEPEADPTVEPEPAPERDIVDELADAVEAAARATLDVIEDPRKIERVVERIAGRDAQKKVERRAKKVLDALKDLLE
jgi:hypothetical protein